MPTPPPSTDLLGVLRCHHLIGRAEVVDVADFQQRNFCSLVTLSDGRVLFAKRARRNWAGDWTADVVGEGNRMRQLATLPTVGALMPSVLVVDEDRRLLVVEGVVPGLPLDEIRRSAGGSDPIRAAVLGRALAALHNVGGGAVRGLPVVDHAGPALRNWARMTPRSVTLFPPGYRELAVRIQAGDYLDRLGELAGQWRQDSVIHGDVKSDNVLLDNSTSLRLIDWECAGWGDARWDVGSAVGDYLFGWLQTMRVNQTGGLASWIDTASPSLPQLRGELTALLESYRSGRTPAAVITEEDLAAWMRYAGMFLLHRLTMAAMQVIGVGSRSLAMLQMSRQLVQSPYTALEVLVP